MHDIYSRKITNTVRKRLIANPAIALLGARQVGKTTISELVRDQMTKAVYLDLERPADLIKLTDAEAFFNEFREHLIVLDEIQRTPDIFPVLRSVIDRNKRNAQFLILGSASRDLIRQSSETLAGRLSYNEVIIIAQVDAEYPLAENVRVKPLHQFLKQLI